MTRGAALLSLCGESIREIPEAAISVDGERLEPKTCAMGEEEAALFWTPPHPSALPGFLEDRLASLGQGPCLAVWVCTLGGSAEEGAFLDVQEADALKGLGYL